MTDFETEKPLHHDPQIHKMLFKLKEKDEKIKIKFQKFEKKMEKYGSKRDRNNYLSPRMNELHSNLITPNVTSNNFR